MHATLDSAEGIIATIAVICLAYYFTLMRSDQEPDGSIAIKFHRSHYTSPSPRRVESVVLAIIARALNDQVVASGHADNTPAITIDRKFLRALEAGKITAIRLRQARMLKHTRAVASLLMVSVAGLVVTQLFSSLELGKISMTVGFIFILVTAYDFYTLLRLDLYVEENVDNV